jgi:hypothetical protein
LRSAGARGRTESTPANLNLMGGSDKGGAALLTGASDRACRGSGTLSGHLILQLGCRSAGRWQPSRRFFVAGIIR